MITRWEVVATVPAGRGQVAVSRGHGEAGVERVGVAFMVPRRTGELTPKWSWTARVPFGLDLAPLVASALEAAVDGLTFEPSAVEPGRLEGSVGFIREAGDGGVEVTRWQGRACEMISLIAVAGEEPIRSGDWRRPVAVVTLLPRACRPLAALLRTLGDRS